MSAQLDSKVMKDVAYISLISKFFRNAKENLTSPIKVLLFKYFCCYANTVIQIWFSTHSGTMPISYPIDYDENIY